MGFVQSLLLFCDYTGMIPSKVFLPSRLSACPRNVTLHWSSFWKMFCRVTHHSTQNWILQKMAYLLSRTSGTFLYSFRLIVELMSSYFILTTCFLRRTIIFTEKTSIYENQIFLSTLSASKLVKNRHAPNPNSSSGLVHA
jgi:hypothetical protein